MAMTGTMKVKCCICGADLGTKPCKARHDGKTSHGYCPECAKKPLKYARRINSHA